MITWQVEAGKIEDISQKRRAKQNFPFRLYSFDGHDEADATRMAGVVSYYLQISVNRLERSINLSISLSVIRTNIGEHDTFQEQVAGVMRSVPGGR